MSIRRWVIFFSLLMPAFPVFSAQWWDVRTADVEMDLLRARAAALEVLRTRPDGADAVAVAGWWFDRNLEVLRDPGEILEIVTPPLNPELAFTLDRIEAQLNGGVPAGALREAEISGPWGVFGRLDLRRGVVVRDDELPPPGTPWRGPGSHYRVDFESLDGWVEVPLSMRLGGVVLSAWTIELDETVEGYLIVETESDLDFQVDGVAITRILDPDLEGRRVNWFRVRLEAGRHRFRAAMAPQDAARARLHLYGLDGRPISFRTVRAPALPCRWSASVVEPVEPPTPGVVPDPSDGDARHWLRAMAIAGWRGDTEHQKNYLERALEAGNEDAMSHLTAAFFSFWGYPEEAREVLYDRIAEHLRACRDLPFSLLVERLLAKRQRRDEDVQRLEDRMFTEFPLDPRVINLRIRQAIERRWPQEAMEALEDLERVQGIGEYFQRMRLDVFEGLDRWSDYRHELETLTTHGPPRLGDIDRLAESCSTGAALDMVDALRTRVRDPDLDLDRIRLLLRSDRKPEAREALSEALTTWGELPDLVGIDLSLILEDADPGDRRAVRVLDEHPPTTELWGLAWERGVREPFWAPYRVDALEVAAASSVSEQGVDSVLLLDQAVERVFPDGSSLYYYHGLSKALTPAGAQQAARIEPMPGALWMTLAIHKPDGRRIVPAEITETARGIQLGEVEEGDLIEEEYVAGVRAISPGVPAHLSPYVYRFADSDRAFGLSEYILLHPPEIELGIEGLFTGLETITETRDGLEVLRWKATDVPARPDEPYGPPIEELMPWVAYGFGADWKDVGDNLRERLISITFPARNIRKFSKEHFAGTTDAEKLESLVRALLNSVEPGDAALDLQLGAGVALSRGRGNRLGVLASLLLSAGWDVDIALSRPTPFAGSRLGIPAADVFRIPLLRARHGEFETWVDLEEEITGVGHISPLVQGSDALMLPLGDLESDVFILPELPRFPNPQLEQRTALEADIDTDGNARVVFSLWLRGAEATQFEENLRKVPADRIDMVFGGMASGLFPGASGVRGEVERQGEELRVRFIFDLSEACSRQGDTMTCAALGSGEDLTAELASLPERTQPLILQLPILRREQVTLRPPPGWDARRPPRRLERSWGKVEETVDFKEGQFRSTLVLEIPAVTVSPEEYPEFARFIRAVGELTSRPPRLHRTD